MQRRFSRRNLLIKILQASGGFAVAGALPDVWKTPELAVGYLPAHGAGSTPYKLVAYNTSQLNQDASGYFQLSASMLLEVIFTYLGQGAVADVTVWVSDLQGNQYQNPILPPGQTGADGLIQFQVTNLDVPYSAGEPFRFSVTVASPVVLQTVVAGTFVVA